MNLNSYEIQKLIDKMNRMRTDYIRLLLSLAKAYAYIGDLEKANEYIHKATDLIDGNNDKCIVCKLAKSKGLIEIIEQLEDILDGGD